MMCGKPQWGLCQSSKRPNRPFWNKSQMGPGAVFGHLAQPPVAFQPQNASFLCPPFGASAGRLQGGAVLLHHQVSPLAELSTSDRVISAVIAFLIRGGGGPDGCRVRRILGGHELLEGPVLSDHALELPERKVRGLACEYRSRSGGMDQGGPCGAPLDACAHLPAGESLARRRKGPGLRRMNDDCTA